MNLIALFLSLLLQVPDPANEEHLRLAASYSAAREGLSMLVMIEGKIVFEEYPNGGAAERAHFLASGTKSFSGVMAACAVEDGLLQWDEPVADTITEWKEDPSRSKITIRHLLSLTSGLDAGSNQKTPSYSDALKSRVKTEPGRKFSYGPVPYQIFGEVMRRKLKKQDEDVMEYLQRRIFDPVGMKYSSWRKDADGNPHLPAGARLTAREWIKFGEMVRLGGGDIVESKHLRECFIPGRANKRYGLTWWLNQEDTVQASGKGKQRLYINPELKLVIVRQAPVQNKARFQDGEFLSRLLYGTDSKGRPAKMEEPSGKPDPVHYRSKAELFITKHDKDEDGNLSKDELPPSRTKNFEKVDFNGDGLVSVEELSKALASRDRSPR
jgi:CubicO group peptidase (beta-lactamase class C family)